MTEELIETRKRMSPAEQKIIDKSGLLIIVIRGYAKTVNTTVGGCEALMTLISKQSCAKEGPLFGDWGSDGDGYVSNYLESKSLSILKNSVCLMLSFEGMCRCIGNWKTIFQRKLYLQPMGSKLLSLVLLKLRRKHLFDISIGFHLSTEIFMFLMRYQINLTRVC